MFSGKLARGKRWYLRLWMPVLVSILTLAGAGIALADSRETITDISLTIEANMDGGAYDSGEVEVTGDEDGYTVEGAEIVNFYGSWGGGDRPEVEITLYAEDGYRFAGSSNLYIDFSGEDAELVSTRREDDSTVLYVRAQLEPVAGVNLSVNNVRWNQNNGTAHWQANDNALYYQIRLYRNGSQIASVQTQRDTYNSYSFVREITTGGTYYFEIRAVGGGSSKGDWECSEEWYVSSNEAAALQASGSTKNSEEYGQDGGKDVWQADPNFDDTKTNDQDPAFADGSDDANSGPGVVTAGGSKTSGSPSGSGSSASSSSGGGSTGTVTAGSGTTTAGGGITGAQVPGGVVYIYTNPTPFANNVDGAWRQDEKGRRFQKKDGTFVVDCWQMIDGLWYCMDGSGYPRTGWIESGNKWYYCGTDGIMLVNAKTPDNYFVGGDGAWIQ